MTPSYTHIIYWYLKWLMGFVKFVIEDDHDLKNDGLLSNQRVPVITILSTLMVFFSALLLFCGELIWIKWLEDLFFSSTDIRCASFQHPNLIKRFNLKRKSFHVPLSFKFFFRSFAHFITIKSQKELNKTWMFAWNDKKTPQSNQK